jgi:hypothetical protein
MERRIIYKGEYDYIIQEDGKIFLPAREFTFFRFNKPVTTIREARESKYQIMKNGYKKCALGLVHRVVAEAFIGQSPHPKYTVNHKDGNKLNNHYTNLEWISHTDNVNHWIYSDNGLGVKLHPIEVHTKDGEYVGVYSSKSKAANELGIHKSTVTEVVKGRLKSTGGYIFKEISKKEYYAKTNSREI